MPLGCSRNDENKERLDLYTSGLFGRSLDSVFVYDTFIYMIFDILFILTYFIYFDRM